MFTKAALAVRSLRKALAPRPDHAREAACRQVSGSSEANRGDWLAIYAHRSPLDAIEPYVLAALQAWHKLGIPIVFVTGNASLPEQELSKVLPLERTAMVRDRGGSDFGSYRTGLALTPDVE